MYRILLLEEERDQSCRIRDYLQISGFSVREVEIESGVDYSVVTKRVDIVVLFCKHSERLFHVCEEVRNVTLIPILILSENSDEWAKIRMFQAGADDYLIDPVPQGELIARVKANVACYRRLTRPFGYIKVRGLEIEVFTRKVKVEGVPVKLTAREFDLLLFLAQNSEHVFTKNDLYNAIWKEENSESYYNAVAVYIKRLRNKIEEDPENPQYIETIWGVGYRFRD